MKNSKQPKLLDFSGDILEAVEKLESVICNTPWNQRLHIYDEAPNEAKLLIGLLRSRAIVIGEVYYTPVKATDEIRKRAQEYLTYLHKREVDGDLLNVAAYFQDREIEMPSFDKNALFFPHIKAYVRCGDLLPEKLFDFLQRDGCERVIVFNGARPDENSPDEAFYSFEMQAPKACILERLENLQNERHKAYIDIMEKSGLNSIFPKADFSPFE